MTTSETGHPDMTSDPFDLGRFISAQERAGTYTTALNELQKGRKQSHWMWFVFPQIAGLGKSAAAQRYAITTLAEARAYLAHPVLGHRLMECARALNELPTTDPVQIFGPLDARKLRSSMTLFAHAAQTSQDRTILEAVLDKYFEGQEDQATLRRL